MNKMASFLIFICALIITYPLQAQNRHEQHQTVTPVPIESDGSFFIDLKNKAIPRTKMELSLNSYFNLSDQNNFKLFNESDDQLGFRHSAYRQFYKGVLVEDGMILLHSRDGMATSMNGSVGRLSEDFPIQTQINENAAIAIAENELGLINPAKSPITQLVITRLPGQTAYALAYKITLAGIKRFDSTFTRMHIFVDAVSGEVINTISLIAHASERGKAHTLYSGVQDIHMESHEGVYRLRDLERDIITLSFDKANVSANGIIRNLTEYVNPTTTWEYSWCLDSITLLKAADPNLFPSSGKWTPFVYIMDTGNSRMPVQGPIYDYNSPKQAPMIFSGIGLNLVAAPYKVMIGTQNASSNARAGLAFFELDATGIVEGTQGWSDTIGNEGLYHINKKANPALDAHWGMGRTYDYFKETFGRNSYDGKKGPITNLINGSYNFTGDQANAVALSGGIMAFGLGDRYMMGAVVCLDVVAHEFSHLVTENNSHGGLVYQGESGALNESFSDIFGTCIEFYSKGTAANWTIGEDACLRAPWIFRSMSNPKLRSHPDTYGGQYWANPANLKNDDGGVHINSGVQNKWFYLLCEGGSGTNDKGDAYLVNSIGMEKAQQIAYRNLTTYLTPLSGYIDAYRGSLQAAEDLYGNSGAEYAAVKAAWFAVGIDATTNLPDRYAKTPSIEIYPNPAADQINIGLEGFDAENILLTIRDIAGRVWITENKAIRNAAENQLKVDIRSLAQGTYFLEIESKDQKQSHKVAVYR